MNSATKTHDERLNELVTEVAELTGENYVEAMCRALEERRDRLIPHRAGWRSGGVVRVTLEAEIPEEMLGLLPGPDEDEDLKGDNFATRR